MAPPRRSTPPDRRQLSTRGNGWLSVQRRKFTEREARDEHGDDGLPLGDETLLVIYSGLSGTKDLVRCAATCRRWLRLVSAEAAFLCRTPPRSDRFIRRLAVGFFHNHHGGAGSTPPTPPCFVPLWVSSSSSSSRQLSLGMLAEDGLLDSSRVVASRNGRLVLDLRRTKGGHVLRLCVCNPMTGEVDFLPPLRGKDAPGPYACTVLTATDEYGLATASSYRLILVFNRRSFTAFRCYSSEAACWGPEGTVTGARIGKKRLGMDGEVHPAIVHRGVIFWPRLGFDLQLSTLQPAATEDAKLPYTVEGSRQAARRRGHNANGNSLVGVMPDGRVCVIEADNETIRVYYTDLPATGCGAIGSSLLAGIKKWQWTMKVGLIGPEFVHTVKLRWFFGNSGVVLFTARNGYASNTYVYAMDVETKQFCRVAGGQSFGEIYGYEMDRVALLASLAR